MVLRTVRRDETETRLPLGDRDGRTQREAEYDPDCQGEILQRDLGRERGIMRLRRGEREEYAVLNCRYGTGGEQRFREISDIFHRYQKDLAEETAELQLFFQLSLLARTLFSAISCISFLLPTFPAIVNSSEVSKII